MKERLLMGLIGLVIILFLTWGVMAVASSYNQTLPKTAKYDVPYKTIVLDDNNQSDVQVSPERGERPRFPDAKKLETSH